MDYIKVLEKAIQKANDNGWELIGKSKHYVCPRCEKPETYTNGEYCPYHGTKYSIEMLPNYWHVGPSSYDYGLNREFSLYVNYGNIPDNKKSNFMIIGSTQLIFNHEFAKALWKHPDDWQHHIQQMVLSDKPIEYIADNI